MVLKLGRYQPCCVMHEALCLDGGKLWSLPDLAFLVATSLEHHAVLACSGARPLPACTWCSAATLEWCGCETCSLCQMFTPTGPKGWAVVLCMNILAPV